MLVEWLCAGVCSMKTDEMTVVFGKASAVTRSTASHVTGTVRTYANDVSGDIRTQQVDEERALIVLESGREVPVRIVSSEAVMRDGGEYALLIYKDQPIMIGGVNSGSRKELETHSDDERNSPPSNAPTLLAFPFFVVAALAIPFGAFHMNEGSASDGQIFTLFVGVAALIFAMTLVLANMSRKESWKDSVEQSDKDREKILISRIEEYLAGRKIA
ncbi:hypothetical protein [Paracoccus indicus]|uniref:hypothetical protein n=1 Tax=Paracoccus indicus TaxID=2079229 RepID=UPI0013B3C9DA|nr:hypothetical protein [Paracoccus indicus]